MFEDRDLYEAFYTDYLWRLLPEVYRASDSDDPDKAGPLRELVVRLGKQIAVVRRSIDRSVEDQSIESCDDWLIPYIGDLLATNLVAGLDARAQRLDVAKTIYYRRRKGTVGILEEIAADITGWNARAVEFFRRLSRTRHNYDPQIGLERNQSVIEGLRGTLSGTAAGGFADLRHASGAQKCNTAFDEFSHLADFRKGRDGSGWHNIPKLGFFLWRLRSYRYVFVDPVADSVCPKQLTFDPTGREIPLFAKSFRSPEQYGDAWVTPDEWMQPGRIDSELLIREQTHLYPESFGVFDVSNAGATTVPLSTLRVNPERGRFEAATSPAGGVARRVLYHRGFSSEIGAGPYDRETLQMTGLQRPGPAAPVAVTGGGGQLENVQTALGPNGTILIGDSVTYTAVANPWNVSAIKLEGGSNQCPVLRLTGAPWIIIGEENATLSIEGPLISGAEIILRGTFDILTISCSTLDPGEDVGSEGAMPQSVDGRTLLPSSIWVEGSVRNLIIRRAICGPIRTRGGGAIERIAATDSIIQAVRTFLPGELAIDQIADAHGLIRRLRDGSDPLSTFLRGTFSPIAAANLAAYDPANPPEAALLGTIVTELNTILGAGALYSAARFAAISLPASLNPPLAGLVGPALLQVNRLLLESAFPIELAPAAMATATAHISLERTTVLGTLYAHRISASESILHGYAVAEDTQSGCVRFSTFVRGSRLHQPYESVAIDDAAAIFESRRYGQPEYAQLKRFADREIRVGAPAASIVAGSEDGSEMGAFSLEKNSIKERGLRIKLGEFMPIGLTPVLIFVT